MPLNLNSNDIELLWLIQPNLSNGELDIKKKFDKPSLSIDVNDLMYITISSDFDYIYKLNPSSSAYRCNSAFFVFKVNANIQTVQDYLVIKLNKEIESIKLDSFMSYFMDYTDLLDLESSSLKNETLRKIFLQFKRKEICAFNKNEDKNRKEVLDSLNFHHDVYIDKDKAEMITNGSQAIGNGIVSLAQMASNMIENIGTQISTNCELSAQTMDTDSAGSSITSCSDESGDEEEETIKEASKEKITEKVLAEGLNSSVNKNEDKKTSEKKEHHRRHHRHHRHSKKHRRDHEKNEENEEERAERHAARRHRRRSRRAANFRKLNQFTKSFAETATIVATTISSVISESASYVVPAAEEYLPGIISSVTNYDEETSRKMVGSTLGYGKVALDAMSNIKNGVQESVGIIGSTVVNQTTQVVKSKFGEEVAEETADALGTLGNVATTYSAMKKAKKIV